MLRNMKKLRQSVIIGVVALALIGGGTALAVSQFGSPTNVRDPETVKPLERIPATIPFLVPPDTETYSPQLSGDIISASDKRPVAQLSTPPDEAGETVEALFPTGELPKADQVGYTILSSVRYTGSGHTIIVTTSRLSLAAAKQQVTMGDESTELANGTKAWVTSGLPAKTSIQVVFLSGDLIITVASDLPVDRIKQLASNVVVNNAPVVP